MRRGAVAVPPGPATQKSVLEICAYATLGLSKAESDEAFDLAEMLGQMMSYRDLRPELLLWAITIITQRRTTTRQEQPS